MKRAILQFTFILFIWLGSLCGTPTPTPFAPTENLPTSMQGRIRSLDSAARLWLYDLYHAQQIRTNDLSAFNTQDRSALGLQWKIHFLGHTPFNEAPLFWIHYAELKTLLNLDPNLTRDRFSFDELSNALNSNSLTNLKTIKPLIAYEFAKAYNDISNRAKSERIELTTLSKGLWATLRGDEIIILSSPATSPWQHLKAGMTIEGNARNRLSELEKQYRTASNELTKLLQTMRAYSENRPIGSAQDPYIVTLERLQSQNVSAREIESKLEAQHPLAMRLAGTGATMKMLPSRYSQGDWISLHSLLLNQYNASSNTLGPIANFTTFSDADFIALRTSYNKLVQAAIVYYTQGSQESSSTLRNTSAEFTSIYYDAYSKITETPYKRASGKALFYPSEIKLKIESLYYKLPLIEIACIAYLSALILFLINMKFNKKSPNSWAVALLIAGFILHTAVLVIRCYILSRPPVSNMFETVIYVPWIALAIGFVFYFSSRSILILSSATLASLALLVLLKITNLDSRLENVQAVLDSQYWLIIHVLMVVGSYGAFVVCGILGHFYLLARWRGSNSSETLQDIAKGTLYTMYVGVALLIPGTILGGVWAAESWGRFWDWDPKESWAFISACVYLLIIHAYTFKRIADRGLALGSICGLMAISFTWYGVNYVLGAGLHTYGFGNGGEGYYYAYLTAEVLFMVFFSRGPLGKKLLEVK